MVERESRLRMTAEMNVALRRYRQRPEPSADLLRQLDDDPLRAADVAEPIAVFVALHLANELRAAGSQASDDGVDVVDCECAMADARGVRRRVPVAALDRRLGTGDAAQSPPRTFGSALMRGGSGAVTSFRADPAGRHWGET
jgi:hypothetical protein